MTRPTVLVLGGYGQFGGRIARRLAMDGDVRVVVAGRDLARANAFCDELARRFGVDKPQALALDVSAAAFASQLAQAQPTVVIHAAGPFQNQRYDVARAAIAARSHYVDLADGRDFVVGIEALDADARANDVLVVSGASTVPGVSAAVVDAFVPEFARLDAIDCGISPGNRTARGAGTVAAILSYVGHPFAGWEDARRKTLFGWQRLRHRDYPAPTGRRWLADCDVPDLALFPKRYGGVRDVRFGAGLELRRLHFGLFALSVLARLGWVRDWSRYTRALKRMSEWFLDAGSDVGAMHLALRGVDAAGAPRDLLWQLVATDGDGPEIPCTPSIVLARKLCRGELSVRGAQPCLGLFTLAECLAGMRAFAIGASIERR